jgi:hypothetical protein
MSLSLKTALKLGRVSNVPTVWTNVAAGFALCHAEFRLGLFVAVAGFMSAQYIGGMYLNDAFDERWDRANRPDRPIVMGQVSSATVFTIGFALLAIGVLGITVLAATGVVSWRSAVAAWVLAVLIVYYDLHHKGNAIGPLIMGLCRVGVYLVAGFATTGAPTVELYVGAALLLGHLIGLTYIAKHETRGKLLRLWPILFFAPSLAWGVYLPTPWLVVGALYFAYTLGAGIAPALGWGTHGKGSPGKAVPSLIAGISLLDAMFVSESRNYIAVAFCLAAFALTRFWQRHVPGT